MYLLRVFAQKNNLYRSAEVLQNYALKPVILSPPYSLNIQLREV